MHIVCTICSDLVNQVEDLHVTPCGHLFHHHCLSQWIDRSKTCPQCRNKVTEKGLIRIYPTVSSDQTLDDATTLQSRLDDAQLQVRQHTQAYNELNDKLKQANDRLERTIDMLKANEHKLVTRESAVKALKDQLDYVKVQNNETNKLREENETLKKNMQTLTALQKVLNATSFDVEIMLQDYSDVRTVATFATALKRALCESEAKKGESRARLQEARSQLAVEKSNVVSLHLKLTQARNNAASLAEKLTNSEAKLNSCEAKLNSCEAKLRASEANLRASESRLREHQHKLWQVSCRKSQDSETRDTSGPDSRTQRDAVSVSDLNMLRDSELLQPAEEQDETRDPSEDMETAFIVDQSDIQAAVIDRLGTAPRALKRSLSASVSAAAAVWDDAPPPRRRPVVAAADADSPYLRLSRGGLALAAVNQLRGGELAIKPTEFNSVNSLKPNKIAKLGSENQPSQVKPQQNQPSLAKPGPAPAKPQHNQPSLAKPGPAPAKSQFSIFRSRHDAGRLDWSEGAARGRDPDLSFDGLGGHSRPDTFPARAPACLPRLTARHRLKKPAAVSLVSVSTMLQRMKEK